MISPNRGFVISKNRNFPRFVISQIRFFFFYISQIRFGDIIFDITLSKFVISKIEFVIPKFEFMNKIDFVISQNRFGGMYHKFIHICDNANSSIQTCFNIRNRLLKL